ncbi:hypothetical protein L9F63_011250, partial [Diploptera punctata]
ASCLAKNSHQSYPTDLSFEKNERHNCGASIITNYFAISAAHCVYKTLIQEKFHTEYYLFHLISRNINVNRIKLKEAIKRRSYGSVQEQVLADMEVMCIPLITTRYIRKMQPIPLANKNPPLGAVGIVTGYGLITVDGPVQAAQLQKLQISTVSPDLCQQVYSTNITENMICAGISGDEGTCFGDSGGPFVVNGALVGLVSFGPLECEQPRPGVFADVPAMLDFVKEVTANS